MIRISAQLIYLWEERHKKDQQFLLTYSTEKVESNEP